MSNLGWTVLHALWQVTAIGGAAAACLACLRRARPDVRGRVAWAALVLMALVPAVTACLGETSLGWQMRRAVTIGADARVGFAALVETMPTVARDAAFVWIAGVTVTFAHLLVSYVRARRLARHDTTPVEPAFTLMARTLAEAMQVRRPVDVRYSSRVSGPLVLGWRTPQILLPRTAVTALTAPQLRGIVTHELAHVKRGDYAANLLQETLGRLLFFHPAAWWVSARIREEREYCCDDAAVDLGRDAAGYAHALAALEDVRDGRHLAVAATSATLLQRIQRLAGRSRRGLTPLAGLLVLGMTWMLAAVMFGLLITAPPSLPPGSKLRRRQPPPAGRVLPGPRGAPRASSGG